MARADIDIIAPIVKGDYDSTAAYNRLNIVHGSDGATYQAIDDVPAGTALSNTEYWMQITPKTPVIGSVTDVAYDAGASVTNSGTVMAPVLDFEIPRGISGSVLSENIKDTAGEGDTDKVWSANKSWNEIAKAITTQSVLNNNTDLDTITNNSVYLLANNRTYPHNPYNGTAGYLITINIYTNWYVQYWCRPNNTYMMYFRFNNGSNWNDWQKIFDSNDYSNLLNKTYTNNDALTNEDDVDNIKNNSIVSVMASNEVANWPMGNRPGELITSQLFGGNYYLQMTFPYYSNIATIGKTAREKLGIYTRYFQNDWKDWQFIKMTPRNYTGKYYAFGDSTSWGYSSDHDHAQSPWNYPQIVGDLIGVEVNNLCDPAQGLIKDWSVGTTGNFAIIPTINQMIENGDFENTALITVGWAYNDASYYSSLNFGNPTDPVPSSTEGITTYLGYYAKILDILQAAAPMATVILITGFGSTSNTEGHKADNQFTSQNTFADGKKTVKERYDAMEEMANYNGYFCINQAKGTVINKINANTIIGDNIHPTYDGYRIYGNFIASRIASIYQNV